MEKKQLIRTKPAYFRGQLLLESDFVDEQRYHATGRYRHTLNLHGWGVVRGLDVTRASDSSVGVSAGYAIDAAGHEIEIQKSEVLELSAFPASSVLTITLSYEEEEPPKVGERERRVRNCYGVVKASTGIADAAVVLATVRLDERGRVRADSIATNGRRQIGPQARVGWVRMPFHPIELPQDEEGPKPPPPFRVGATTAASHRKYPGEQPNNRGAGGTMAIPLPPGATGVHRLRIAGAANEKTLNVALWRSGWSRTKMAHVKEELAKGVVPKGAYDQTFDIKNGELHPEDNALSVEITAEGYARVSLIAVQLSYE